MLQHNISRDTVLKDQISLIINSDHLDIADTTISLTTSSSNSFIVNIEDIDRVTKLSVDNIKIPPFYNVHRNNVTLKLGSNSSVGLATELINMIVPDLELSNAADPIASIKQNIEQSYADLSRKLSGLPSVNVNIDVLENKMIMSFEQDGLVPDNVFIGFNNFSSFLGYSERTNSTLGWFSDTLVNLDMNSIVITELNQTIQYVNIIPMIPVSDISDGTIVGFNNMFSSVTVADANGIFIGQAISIRNNLGGTNGIFIVSAVSGNNIGLEGNVQFTDASGVVSIVTDDKTQVKSLTIKPAKYDIYTLASLFKAEGFILTYYPKNNTFLLEYQGSKKVQNSDVDVVTLEILETPLSIALGFTDRQRTTYNIKAELPYQTEDLRYRVDYTIFKIIVDDNFLSTTLPIGKYTIDSLIDTMHNDVNLALQTSVDINTGETTVDQSYILLEYSELTGKISIKSNANSNDTMKFIEGGVYYLLGLNARRPFLNLESGYVFPRSPKIDNDDYVLVCSRLINSIRESKTYSFESNVLIDNCIIVKFNSLGGSSCGSSGLDISNEIFLSKKTTINRFDLFFVDSRGEVIDFNGNSISMLMKFIIS